METREPIRARRVIDVGKLSASASFFGATVKLIDEDTEEEKRLLSDR